MASGVVATLECLGCGETVGAKVLSSNRALSQYIGCYVWLQGATEKRHVTSSMTLAIELAQQDESAVRNEIVEVSSRLDSLRHQEPVPEQVDIEFLSSAPLVDFD